MDIVILLAVISGSITHCMNSETHIMFPQWLCFIIVFISGMVPPSYMLFLVLAQILPKVLQCFTRSKPLVLKRINKFKIKMNAEDQTLLNRVADYSTGHS